MTWIFNESICSPDNCELNETTAYQNGTDFQINATLEIQTELLPVTVYTLQCIVEQNLECSLLIKLVATFNLTVTELIIIDEMFMTKLGK